MKRRLSLDAQNRGTYYFYNYRFGIACIANQDAYSRSRVPKYILNSILSACLGHSQLSVSNAEDNNVQDGRRPGISPHVNKCAP